MSEKETYTLESLFKRLPYPFPISASKSDQRSHGSGIRDGKTARLHTVNKLLATFSELYSIDLTIDNVSGLHILQGRYGVKE